MQFICLFLEMDNTAKTADSNLQVFVKKSIKINPQENQSCENKSQQKWISLIVSLLYVKHTVNMKHIIMEKQYKCIIFTISSLIVIKCLLTFFIFLRATIVHGESFTLSCVTELLLAEKVTSSGLLPF